MSRLRTFSILDSLQPQVAGFLGTVCGGDPPLVGDAALLVEVDPAMTVHRIADAALKETGCKPGLFIVERRYGVLQLHHPDRGQIDRAGEVILAALGEREAMPSEVVTAERITGTDPHHAQIVNRMRHGDLHAPHETLFVLETRPAGVALFAANEAEKASDVKILECRAFGAFGRVYLGGDDASIRLAADRIAHALRAG